jgi:hypothetical protein
MHIEYQKDGFGILAIGQFRYPCQVSSESNRLDGRTHEARQAQLSFESGLELSIVWGSGTYSSNNRHPYSDEPFTEEPRLVETATIRKNGEFVEGDQIRSWQSEEDVLRQIIALNKGEIPE